MKPKSILIERSLLFLLSMWIAETCFCTSKTPSKRVLMWRVESHHPVVVRLAYVMFLKEITKSLEKEESKGSLFDESQEIFLTNLRREMKDVTEIGREEIIKNKFKEKGKFLRSRLRNKLKKMTPSDIKTLPKLMEILLSYDDSLFIRRIIAPQVKSLVTSILKKNVLDEKQKAELKDRYLNWKKDIEKQGSSEETKSRPTLTSLSTADLALYSEPVNPPQRDETVETSASNPDTVSPPEPVNPPQRDETIEKEKPNSDFSPSNTATATSKEPLLEQDSPKSCCLLS